MIINRLRILIAEKETREHRSISYREICDATGISQNALSGLAQNKTTRYYIRTLVKLCEFFNCQVGDLLVYIPSEPDEVP